MQNSGALRREIAKPRL